VSDNRYVSRLWCRQMRRQNLNSKQYNFTYKISSTDRGRQKVFSQKQTQCNIRQRPIRTCWTKANKIQAWIKHNNVKTGDTDDVNDEQVDDWGSEFRCGDKRMLGSVVTMTKTEWCRLECDTMVGYYYYIKPIIDIKPNRRLSNYIWIHYHSKDR